MDKHDKLINQNFAIFPGTFNPVHIGHLMLAESALYQFNLEEIHFVLSPKPPNKLVSLDLLDFTKRKAILEASIQANQSFRLDTREINRVGNSYTIETVLEIKKQYNLKNKLMIIVGLDAFLTLSTWYQAEQLALECHFLVANRPGWDIEEIKNSCSIYHEKLTWSLINSPSLAVSSSEIRARKKQNQAFRYLMEEKSYFIFR